MRLTGQEAVQLDEQLQVDVVTLWRLAVSAANMVCVKIDTYIKAFRQPMFNMLFVIWSCNTNLLRRKILAMTLLKCRAAH